LKQILADIFNRGVLDILQQRLADPPHVDAQVAIPHRLVEGGQIVLLVNQDLADAAYGIDDVTSTDRVAHGMTSGAQTCVKKGVCAG